MYSASLSVQIERPKPGLVEKKHSFLCLSTHSRELSNKYNFSCLRQWHLQQSVETYGRYLILNYLLFPFKVKIETFDRN